MNKKKSGKQKKQLSFEMDTQDETFYFIAGYTSGGAPYGMTWEEAYEDGLVEKDDGEIGDEIQGEHPFI